MSAAADGPARRRSPPTVVAVCLNPAMDVTYEVPRVTPGQSHRVCSVAERPGGKAINTARVLCQVSVGVVVCGFVGGDRGQALRTRLAGAGLKDQLTAIAGETRRSVAVAEPGQVTVFNEPGPEITEQDWHRLTKDVDTALAGADAMVLAGSVPPGVPTDAYGQLIEVAHQHHVRTVVDATGTQLAHALDAKPAIAAPNDREVAETLGVPVDGDRAALDAAARLCRLGAGASVVSSGADGLVAVTRDRSLRGRPPRILPGNPTGAGDALTAALARGLAEGRELPDMLTDGLALSGSAVVCGVAGEVDLPTYGELLRLCHIEEVDQ